MRTSRFALTFTFLTSVLALAAALVTQHFFDMQPCPWCIAQRMAFALLALVSLMALATTVARGALALSAQATALAGAAMALWQHFGAKSEGGCSMSYAQLWIERTYLDVLLPAVFEPRASCADAAVDLLRVPYEFWSLALFLVIAGVLARAAVRPRSS